MVKRKQELCWIFESSSNDEEWKRAKQWKVIAIVDVEHSTEDGDEPADGRDVMQIAVGETLAGVVDGDVCDRS